MPAPRPDTNRPEPLWPAVIGVLAVGGLYFALPEHFSPGPSWLLLSVVTTLAVPGILARHYGRLTLHRILGHAISLICTAFMFYSLSLLIHRLLTHSAPPASLLRAAAVLWLTNILVFTDWYWRLDAGGPHARATRRGHETGAFLFPQMTLTGPAGDEPDGRPWSPQYVDYLFLSFNTSTAFSPTDSPTLSRWAKALMMTQSLISLTTTLIVIARAINIL